MNKLIKAKKKFRTNFGKKPVLTVIIVRENLGAACREPTYMPLRKKDKEKQSFQC